jgi:hypothetical protein
MKVELWTLDQAKKGDRPHFDPIQALRLALSLDRASTSQATEAGDATQPVNLSNTRNQ